MQPYSAEEICRALGEDVPVFVLDGIDSTNTEARRRALSAVNAGSAPTCSVFVAARQTGGRGRQGKSFLSPPGGLYLSVLVPTEVGKFDPVGITVSASVEAANAISEVLRREVEIKWVNDLLFGGKKVAGILAETVAAPAGGTAAVILGIGVNLDAAFGSDLPEAGSLFPPGAPIPRNELAGRMARGLFRAVRAPLADGTLDEYRRRSAVLGHRVRFLDGGAWYPAFAESIREDGALGVRLEDGTRRFLQSGEISLRREETP